MKYARLILVVLVFAAFIPPVFSQESMVTLKHKELGKHERPIIEFNHESHSTKIDCLQCHHDYDVYGNNRGGEGQPCETCHAKAKKQDVPGLKDAFHQQCKSCHELMRKQGKPTGPVTCGQCHVKK